MLKTTTSTMESHKCGIPLARYVSLRIFSSIIRVAKHLKHATEFPRCNNHDSCVGFTIHLDRLFVHYPRFQGRLGTRRIPNGQDIQVCETDACCDISLDKRRWILRLQTQEPDIHDSLNALPTFSPSIIKLAVLSTIPDRRTASGDAILRSILLQRRRHDLEYARLDVARETFVTAYYTSQPDSDLLGVSTRFCVRMWAESQSASDVYG
jgi:hypothetical protein